MSIEQARRVIASGVVNRIYPAAVAEVGAADRVLWCEATGTRTFSDSSPIETDSPFDLASLTKVLATTTVAMALADVNALRLDDRVTRHFAEWRGKDRLAVTVRDLLEHASGLPARLVDRPPGGRREFEHEICGMALEYEPRSRSVYSDLGFILIGFLVADVGGAALGEQFARVWPDPALAFGLADGARHRAAPTEPLDGDVRRGRLLIGEVHDDYAAALGGVAGHAGLFGTAAAVGRFARMLLELSYGRSVRTPFPRDRFFEMTTRSTVAGSSRALGWDTMLPSSSCGTRMSSTAFGHVGFTGTSLWIDPQRDRYFVLLTNRACGGGTVDEMRTVRRAFHDALADV
jgi:CubicO group peptidase (beta-lactamase class C family)